jgi:hypothetical protein
MDFDRANSQYNWVFANSAAFRMNGTAFWPGGTQSLGLPTIPFSNIYGSINASYIQNAPWLTAETGIPITPYKDLNTYFCDFIIGTYAVTNCQPDFYGVATNSGVSAPAVSYNGTYGTYTLSRGTTAANGYIWTTAASAFLLQGSNETFMTLFNVTTPTATGAITNVSTTKLGFCDATAATATCTDGVYINITSNSTHRRVRGTTQSNSVTANTPTEYNITSGANYIYKVILINRSQAQFYVYTFPAGTLAWQDNVSSATAIPITNGRETGAMVSYFENLAGAAAIRAKIDYVYVNIPTPYTQRFK